MSDEAWRGTIIRSIPPTPKWLPVIPSLYAMPTSADIVSTLFAHRMIVRGDSTKTNSSNTALAAQTSTGCTNPKCKARKRSTHTIEDCYWEGGGKDGQFPPNFGQKKRANTATSTPTPTSNQPEHFVLSVRIPDTSGQSGVLIDTPNDNHSTALISQGFQKFQKGKVPTFMDSGASDTMFISRDVFTEYKPIAMRTGDSAKADNGSFEIVGEGSVVQRY